jgi:polyferredoxin
MWERNGPRLAVLVLFLVLMVLVSRPFCRTFCPLGASYGLLSRAALCRVEVDLTACVRCRRCDRVCPVDLDVAREVGGPECIACGDCIRACPQNGIHRTYGLRTPAPGRTTLNPAPASACEGATHVA